MVGRALPACVAALLAAALTGCTAGAGTTGAPRRDDDPVDDLTVGMIAEPANLDFTTTDGAAIPQALLDNVYEGLVTLDDDGRIVPALARSWEVSPDRRTYTFRLVDDATFSTGAPFTAEDAVFSVDRVRTSWTTSLARAMDVVEKASAPDPHTLVVTLRRPSNDWLYRMTTRVGAMFSRTGVDALATAPVGTGPYVVDRWTRGQSLHLARRPDGHRGAPPFFRTVTLRYFKDPTALDNAMLTNTVDVVSTVQAPESLVRYAGDPRFRIVEGTTTGEVVLAFNSGRAPFDDPAVRRAARLALDRRALRDACWAGRGTLIGSMVPPTDPWYEDLTGVRPHDPDAARSLLARSRHPGAHVTLRLPTLPYATSCGQVVADSLGKVGFDIALDQVEFPAGWVTRVMKEADYDASIVAHVEPRDLPTLYGSPDSYLHYDDPTLRRLLERADTADPAQQADLMRRAARRIAEQDASDWLFLLPNLTIATADVRGLPRNRIRESFDVTGLSRG